jgi:hypothetical protein
VQTAYENELFSRGRLRASVHLRRFRWLVHQIHQAGYKRISAIELGCGDGRLIDMLEAASIEVKDYYGFDAN